MKKLTILAALCALLLGSCAENNLDGVTPETAITLPDLTAGFAENDTKTYVENGKYLRWHEADLITAFFGNTLNRQFKFKGKTGANSGTFSLVPSGELGTGNNLNAIYAIYPYDESATITDEGAMTINLPAVQNYAENSFGKGANTMMSVTAGVEDTFLGFKNACGYLKLKLYGEDVTLASVEVIGNNGEKIAGSATATMEFDGVPTLAMNNDATTTVTLDCGEGVVLGTTAETATELWIVLPETTFEGGITITATDTEGITFEKSTTNPIAIVRNEIQPMAALEVEFVIPEPKPANNEIWYTATAKVEPYDKTVFGANYVSNEWDSTTGEGVITFDGNVSSIGETAFMYSSLSSITIPDSVTSIGDSAFLECPDLANVTIGDNVTEIGNKAFYACSSLAGFTIPDGVTSIGNETFFACISIVGITIPDGVISIGNYAFMACQNLVDITIPDSVTSIGKSAFAFCSSLPVENNIKYADTYAVEVLDKTLTTYTIREGTIFIGDSAFYGCSSFTSVTIPDSVTSIGESAFEYCSSLTSVTIPDSVTSIGDRTFLGCSSLASVTIPDRVTSIGYRTFYGCKSLASVTIPDSVTSIGNEAFWWCSSLVEFKGKFASEDGRCLIVNGVLNSFAPVGLTEYTIPDSVTSIGTHTFYGCSSLASITIGDGVTTIGDEAFYGCTSLASVSIGNGVTSIGDWAFYGCSSLASITIPDSVTSIGMYAFACCTSLASVTIGNGVTSIGNEAFSYCSSLASITIPDSVTSIGNRTFIDCSSLASVTIGNGVTSIGDAAFYACSSLAEVYCKATTPPMGGYNMFSSNASERKIYVPTESVDEYKSADVWSNYADNIVGYNF